MVDPSSDSMPHFTLDASPSAAAVFGAFMRAAHAHRQLMARKMTARGISPAQMFCLKEIGHSPGITQRDLAEQLNVARPTLTVMLHKMEKAGLVERRSDEADQRFTRVYLRDDGTKTHEQMHQAIGEIITETVGPMCEADRAGLARLLDMLSDNIHAALERQED